MTAPQHNARPIAGKPVADKPVADKPEKALEKESFKKPSLETAKSETAKSETAKSETANRYDSSHASKRMQRSWLIALGLLGGSGFVANQMSFALAESDLLIGDYAVAPNESAVNHSATDPTFTYTENTFEPPTAPAQVEYVPAPVTAPPAVSTAPAEPDWVATYQTPLAEPVAEATPVAEPVAAPAPIAAPAPVAALAPASTPSIAIEIETAAEKEKAQVAAAPDRSHQATKQQTAKQQTAEQQVAKQAASQLARASVRPEVSEVASPTFSSIRQPKKPTKARQIARNHPLGRPLRGLVGANAMTAPLSNVALSNYAVGSMAIAPSMVQLSAGIQASEAEATAETTMVVAPEGGAVKMEITPSSELAAVPDIMPAEEPAAPASEPAVGPTELVPAALPEGTNLPDEYNSVFVDPTDYSIGATETAEGAVTGSPEIVVSEQSTGCEFTIGAGQGVPNAACAAEPSLPAAPAPVANGFANGSSGNGAVPTPADAYAAPEYVEAPVASSPAVTVGPVSFSAEGIRFSGATTAAGREYLNRTIRPLINLQAGEQFIFPLPIPSPITSLFGFRTHPISGDHRFHAGTDIGAEQGTPVLAAQDGKVSSAGYAGGYGLMVVLNHKLSDTQLESRYAHLSEILVEPDATVKKGDVIGLVGSTGNSTGPHLHFEMRQLTADGWVLVNADGLIQQSLANLVKALNSPMQALNFSMSDFNLLRTRSGPSVAQANRTEVKTQTTVDSLLPGLNGIPFRPAQPNAS